MANPAFPLTAVLSLPRDDAPELSTAEVARAIQERFPGAIIDWQRGNEHVAQGLQRLIDLGTPEILCRGQRSLFDRMIYVEIPLDRFPPSTLSGYSFGFSDYDGCIALQCRPFDIEAIQAGGLEFARRLDLKLSLTFGDIDEINLELLPGRLGTEEMMRLISPDLEPTQYELFPLADWPSAIAGACARWMAEHPQPRLVENWITRSHASADAGRPLIGRLESIGTVRNGSGFSLADGYHDGAILEYPDWTGILILPGVPTRLFE